MFINNIIFLIRVGPDVLDDGFDMNDEGEQLASNWHSSEIFKPTKKDTLIERIKESPLNHGYDGKKHYPSYPLLKPGAPYLVKVEDPAASELKKDLKKEKIKREIEKEAAATNSGGKSHEEIERNVDKMERKTKKVVAISEPSAKVPPKTTIKEKEQVLPNKIVNGQRNTKFNKKEWTGAIKKVAERLFEDPTIPEIEPQLSHRPDTNMGKTAADTSMVDQLSYAERLQVMIMQVREDTAVAEREIEKVETKEREDNAVKAMLDAVTEDGDGDEAELKELVNANDTEDLNTKTRGGEGEPKVKVQSFNGLEEEVMGKQEGKGDAVSVYSQDSDQF